MTMQQLLLRLAEIPEREREITEVRIVFHGWEQQSFNLPALGVHDPSWQTPCLIICEEPREEKGSESL